MNRLTDEEIVKEFIDEINRGEWCELSFIECVEVRVLKNALDLIHRLQGESEGLKSVNRWLLDRCKIKDGEISEQKAEIERLKEENGEFFPKIYDFIEVRQKRMVEPYKDALTYILRELKLEFGGEDEAN